MKYQKQNKLSMVEISNTTVEPYAVVVHTCYADAAQCTMLTSQWSTYEACIAKLKGNSTKRNHAEKQ